MVITTAGKVITTWCGNWLAGWVTGFDNFDSLGEQNLKPTRKFMFIFGGALADDAGLSVVEPIVQILNGNVASMQRWVAQLTQLHHLLVSEGMSVI